MKVRVCDICKNINNNYDIDYKIKYKAKKRTGHYISVSEIIKTWDKIDICSNCMDRIIYETGKKRGKKEDKE